VLNPNWANLIMTIVHVVEPFAAGVAVFIRSLTESMPDDVHIIVHGERTEVMSADEVKKNFPGKNIRFIRWRSAQRNISPVKDLAALTELYNILRRLKKKKLADAVHLHSSKSGLLGRVACRMALITNVFYTPNGASFLSAKNSVSRYLYKKLEKFGSQMCGQVICCSSSELDQYLKLGINGAYINNGINLPETTGKKAFKKSTDKFIIVTSGRIEVQKNPVLFNAIASSFEDMKQIHFVWIGDGGESKVLKAKNITVTGWLDTNEVHNLVAAANIYLSTSTYEGLSFGVLEALAMKKPVLLSNCTGNKDAVKKGVNGDLFNGEEDAVLKILQYYSNPDMLKVMGAFSAEICRQEFDVKKNFRSYREWYAGIPVKMDGQPQWKFGY
jgi:glycosyltransferase involved in cell wall biosynthesis